MAIAIIRMPIPVPVSEMSAIASKNVGIDIKASITRMMTLSKLRM